MTGAAVEGLVRACEAVGALINRVGPIQWTAPWSMAVPCPNAAPITSETTPRGPTMRRRPCCATPSNIPESWNGVILGRLAKAPAQRYYRSASRSTHPRMGPRSGHGNPGRPARGSGRTGAGVHSHPTCQPTTRTAIRRPTADRRHGPGDRTACSFHRTPSLLKAITVRGLAATHPDFATVGHQRETAMPADDSGVHLQRVTIPSRYGKIALPKPRDTWANGIICCRSVVSDECE